MFEVIAAVIGAFLGVILTWLLGRKRPNHIEYTHLGDYKFRLPPPAKIVFNNDAIDVLCLKRIQFRNLGDEVVNQPKLDLEIGSDAGILAVETIIVPKRAPNDNAISVAEENGLIKIELDALYPYSLNRETLYLDILSKAESHIIGIYGTGLTKDSRGWTVRNQDPIIRIPILGFSAARNESFIPGLSLYILLLGTILGFLGYLGWKVYKGLVSLDRTQLDQMLRDPVFLIVTSITIVVCAISLRKGWQGWTMPIPIPFTSHMVIISISDKDSGFLD